MKAIEWCRLSRIMSGLLIASLMDLYGCAGWSSEPSRLKADYGQSVRNMLQSQIYDQTKYRQPGDLLPDGMEGNKADAILEHTYRGSNEGVGNGDIIDKPRSIIRPGVYGMPGTSSGGTH